MRLKFAWQIPDRPPKSSISDRATSLYQYVAAAKSSLLGIHVDAQSPNDDLVPEPRIASQPPSTPARILPAFETNNIG